MAFKDYRVFLWGIIFLLLFSSCMQAYPSVLYLLDKDNKTIVIWGDKQVSIPIAQADHAISIILDFVSKIPEHAKIIVRSVSLDYDQRCIKKIGKHEHESAYAYDSLVLDTIASRLKIFSQKTLLVQGSSTDIVTEITSVCLSSQEQYIVLFVDVPVAAQIAEQLVHHGFAQEQTTS